MSGLKKILLIILLMFLLCSCSNKKEEPDFASNEDIMIKSIVAVFDYSELDIKKIDAYYFDNTFYYVAYYNFFGESLDYRTLLIIKNHKLQYDIPYNDEEVTKENFPQQFYNYTLAVSDGVHKSYDEKAIDKIGERLYGEK